VAEFSDATFKREKFLNQLWYYQFFTSGIQTFTFTQSRPYDRNHGSSLERDRRIFLFSSAHIRSGVQPASYPSGIGVQSPGRETNHSPPSNVKV
jgi:hypothetical protein